MQRIGKQHALQPEEAEKELGKKHAAKNQPDASPGFPALPGNHQLAANKRGVPGSEENLHAAQHRKVTFEQQKIHFCRVAQVKQQQESEHENAPLEAGIFLRILCACSPGATQHLFPGQSGQRRDTQQNGREAQPGQLHLHAHSRQLPGRLTPLQHAPEQEESRRIVLPGRILAGKNKNADNAEHDAVFTPPIKMRPEDEQHQSRPQPPQHTLQRTGLVKR